MPDPITVLKNLDEVPPAPALPPAEVRRLGDRMRRRRNAAAGVAGVAVVAALGSALVALQGGPASSPPVAPQPTIATPAPTASATPSNLTDPTPDPTRSTSPDSSPDSSPDPGPGTAHLTPDGFDAIRLGMSTAQVRATGAARTVASPRNGMCGSFVLRDFPSRPHAVDGYISARHGVEAVFARPGVTTPEGIGPGSTVAAVKAAYPTGGRGQRHWQARNGYLVVPLGDGVEYEFAVEQDQTIGETLVAVTSPECFG